VFESVFNSAETAEAWARGAAQRAEYLLGATERMLDEARLMPGSRVLDIGTGTGDTATLAARRVGPKGYVLATDASAQMLDAAARAAKSQGLANVEVRQMDGSQVVVDAPFDAIIGRNSMQFLPNWPEPLTGFRAALRPEGRLSFLVWAPMADNPYTALPITVAIAGGWLGRDEASFSAPFSLGDAERLASDLAVAGLRDGAAERIPFEVRLPRDAALANRMDSPMFSSIANRLSDADRTAYKTAMGSAIDRFKDGDSVIARGMTIVASGTA
jgi:SAM-dependent methyltransferase